MSLIIGVDVGGTFTDAFAADDKGLAASAKAASTPPDYARGVMDSLAALATELGRPLAEVLDETAYIAHGTTATINALVTGDTATVGFITTKGHRDSIAIMNIEGRYAGLRPDEIQDSQMTRKPPQLVPKRYVKEVTERVDYAGDVIIPLDEDEVRDGIRQLIDDGVDAIAVSLLWSFRNPAHEHRIRELIREQSPDMYVAISSDVSPRIREFSRNATTIMNTQVAPTLRGYLAPLENDLKSAGLGGPLLVMQGSGGTITAADAPSIAITTVGSVLSGGVIGAQRLAAQLGHRNVISTDVGGTTFLVGLIVDGKPVFNSQTVLNQHIINAPTLEVHAIGSGGGAIAAVDEHGNLRVGPRSAGAVPGPACYDAGGTLPTVTDANLVLGILNDKFFLGGRRSLAKPLAVEALRTAIGEPLGLTPEQAAAAVFEVQNAQTADLLRKVVVGTGNDPRDFVLYAFGGAGPVHSFAYGADLGVQEIVVPLGSTAAAFSAFGLAASDVTFTAELSDPANYPVDPESVTRNFARLEEDVRARLDKQGISFASTSLRREVDIRYSLQMAEVPTPVKGGQLDADDLENVVSDFETRYAQLFGEGSGFRGAGFQFITYRVHGEGHLPFSPTLPGIGRATSEDPSSALKERRPVFLNSDDGFTDTPIYDYSRLAHGHVLNGPAVVEATTTTVVVPKNAVARVDQLGNLVLRYQ